jgi:hypothetical protein
MLLEITFGFGMVLLGLTLERSVASPVWMVLMDKTALELLSRERQLGLQSL